MKNQDGIFSADDLELGYQIVSSLKEGSFNALRVRTYELQTTYFGFNIDLSQAVSPRDTTTPGMIDRWFVISQKAGVLSFQLVKGVYTPSDYGKVLGMKFGNPIVYV